MKLTNRLNLPQPLVDAVKNDGYTRGDADMSVTTLIGPARIAVLRAQYEEQIEEDASDRIWSLLGQSIHTILERANTASIAERRLYKLVAGWKISGGMDAYYPETGLLQDYKTTTVYKFKDGGYPVEFERQLNVYAELLRHNGDKVTKLQAVSILRDWSKRKAQREKGYPQAQVVVVDLPLWSSDRAVAYIKERVLTHRLAKYELPECTQEERWATDDTFAVMKHGAKKAKRVLTSREAAEEYVAAKPDEELVILKREGESIRCEGYCPVSAFCDQYQKLKSFSLVESNDACLDELLASTD